ncbi:hypothetical protein MesoLjLa_60380 [Mesorhizobium sp. L-2-11]|nr:hypothetical protein MesoLjLa_60380 [Mesorhizobium sp. L-2-11]
MASAQVSFATDDKLDVLGDEVDSVSQMNRLRTAAKSRVSFNDDWATFRPTKLDTRWPPAEAESLQAAQRNIRDKSILVISERGREGAFTADEMRLAVIFSGLYPDYFISHYVSAVVWAICKLFDKYPRRRSPYVLLAKQVSGMFGYLFEGAAQSDTDAAAAYSWLQNHRQADLRGRAFNLRRIRCQAISRYWNAGLR